MRMIDADALIDELQKDEAKFDKEAEDAQNDPSYTECYSDAMWSRANGIRDAIIEVYDAPTINAVSEWIPCEEREPSESGTYLVTNRWKGEYSGDIYNDVEAASYEHGRWEIATGIITAWMPLPEPWKGADDE